MNKIYLGQANELKIEKTLVDELRQIRGKINMEIQDFLLEQLKKYWKDQKTLHPKSVWQKDGGKA